MKYLYLQADSGLLLMHAVAILFNNSQRTLTRRDKAGMALRALSLSGFLFPCNSAGRRGRGVGQDNENCYSTFNSTNINLSYSAAKQDAVFVLAVLGFT